MIPEHFLTRFNPQATVPHSRIKTLLITIKQFADTDKKTNTDGEKKDIDPALIEAGLRITAKLAEAKDDLITELCVIFFSLSNQERDDLDFVVRQEMYEKIRETRPELIDFLSLSPSQSSSTKRENPDPQSES